jgi:hypothetical protein
MADTKTVKIDVPKIQKVKADDDDDDTPKPLEPKLRYTLLRSFKLFLTLFYGQFAANAIYSNLIRGIPQLIENPSYTYPIARVTLGILMLLLTGFAVVSISLKIKPSWILIWSGGGVLIVLTLAGLIIDIIDIVQRKERKALQGGELGAEIAELIVENILRTAAIISTFFMGKYIRGFKEYLAVATFETRT